MYFQVCSNSAYPQHSGERYRTSGHPVALSTMIPQTVQQSSGKVQYW